MSRVEAVAVPAARVGRLGWTSVASSNVEAVAYEAAGEVGSVWVRFAGGAVYRYDERDPADHQALLEADLDPDQSVGAMLNRRLRATGPCVRVEVEPDDDAA